MLASAVALGMAGGAALAQTTPPANSSPAGEHQTSRKKHHQKAGKKSMLRSSEIRQVQMQLKQDGFYQGRIDGIAGPRTQAALRQYQSQNNLPVSGRLDQQTMASLGLSSQGMAARQQQTGTLSSDTIRGAQQALEDKGLYNGPVNGVMDPQTRAAIREYQMQNNLPATGRLTQQTATSLGILGAEGPAPGQYFERAGKSLSSGYGEAGRSIEQGTSRAGQSMSQGRIGTGVEQFGKGVGHAARQAGSATGHAGKKAYHGAQKAVVPR